MWNPRVEADDEYSTAQIWLRNGPFNNSDSIEFGWIVSIQIPPFCISFKGSHNDSFFFCRLILQFMEIGKPDYSYTGQ